MTPHPSTRHRRSSSTPFSSSRPGLRRRLAVALGGAAVLASVLLPIPAQAHNYLVSSTPAEGATLTELPETFSITTNEDMLDLAGQGSGFALQVTDAQGRYYGDGCVTVTGPAMTTRSALGVAGAYSVSWQAVSIDGHTVSGEYAFTWAPTSAADLSAGSATVPVCGETVITPAGPAAGSVPPSPSADSTPTSTSTSTSTSTDSAPTASDGDASNDSATGGGGPGSSPVAPLVVGGAVLAAAATVAGVTMQSRRRRGPRP